MREGVEQMTDGQTHITILHCKHTLKVQVLSDTVGAVAYTKGDAAMCSGMGLPHSSVSTLKRCFKLPSTLPRQLQTDTRLRSPHSTQDVT